MNRFSDLCRACRRHMCGLSGVFQIFLVPFQTAILKYLLCVEFRIVYKFLILDDEKSAPEQVLPMPHQSMILNKIFSQFVQLITKLVKGIIV